MPKRRPPRMLLLLQPEHFPLLPAHTCWRATVRTTSLVSLTVILFSRECRLVKDMMLGATRARTVCKFTASLRATMGREGAERMGDGGEKKLLAAATNMSSWKHLLCSMSAIFRIFQLAARQPFAYASSCAMGAAASSPRLIPD